MTELKIGYARVSTIDQDLTAQRDALIALGVDPKRIYVDHGLTGTNRDRPGLRQALAACRRGDTLVVTKLDRLARSVPDARDIVDELTATNRIGIPAAANETPAAPETAPSTGEVRAWARAGGIAVPDRGRLHPDIWQAWRDAQRQ